MVPYLFLHSAAHSVLFERKKGNVKFIKCKMNSIPLDKGQPTWLVAVWL